jgi:hypothetical protein
LNSIHYLYPTVSKDEIIEAYTEYRNIRKTLTVLNLSSGGNYKRVRKILEDEFGSNIL